MCDEKNGGSCNYLKRDREIHIPINCSQFMWLIQVQFQPECKKPNHGFNLPIQYPRADVMHKLYMEMNGFVIHYAFINTYFITHMSLCVYQHYFITHIPLEKHLCVYQTLISSHEYLWKHTHILIKHWLYILYQVSVRYLCHITVHICEYLRDPPLIKHNSPIYREVINSGVQ